jgi:hypothetical protein
VVTNRYFLLSLFLAISLIGIALSIVVLQSQTNSKAKASGSSILSLYPESTYENPVLVNVNDPVALDLMIDPGRNKVSILKFEMKYNAKRFQSMGEETLIINKEAFPVIVEGPIIDPLTGSIAVTLSIGADVQRAITTPTKVGTLKLKPTRLTGDQPERIIFGTKSQAYSVAAQDHAYENVLATAKPAYISIGNAARPAITAAPTTSVSAVLTNQPTASPTTASSSDTIVQRPTATPEPDATVLTIKAFLSGIGKSNNENPLRKSRPVEVTLTNIKTSKVVRYNGTLLYDTTEGAFAGSIAITNLTESGEYSVDVHVDSYIANRTAQNVLIFPGAKLPPVTVSLTAGDTNTDKTINIIDYNTLINCSVRQSTSALCNGLQKRYADINDDNTVDQTDYNLFLSEVRNERSFR